jgi:sterol 3beta-glucosyltransferase
MALTALPGLAQRGVLLTGWGGLKSSDLPDNVFAIDNIPHDWLFPRMAAVVHHGGIGTTAAGLRAGVPSMVIPFFADQPFWAQRVYALGVGPRPVLRKQLTADKLADAIRIAVSDSSIRSRAAALGETLRAEDGVGNTVRLLQQLIAQGKLRSQWGTRISA